MKETKKERVQREEREIEAVWAEAMANDKPKQAVWCSNCCEWVSISTLKRWTGDDRLHRLCPGCDDDLMPVESLPE